MKKITQKGVKGKGKSKGYYQEMARELKADGIDAKVELIQSLIPIGLKYVEEVLRAEVEALAGIRYGRESKGQVRWGRQNGYVYLGGQRVLIEAPRLRARESGRTPFPPSYRELQRPRGRDQALRARFLGGLSCCRYKESAALAPGVWSL